MISKDKIEIRDIMLKAKDIILVKNASLTININTIKFLTGSNGYGKSLFIQYFINQLSKKINSKEKDALNYGVVSRDIRFFQDITVLKKVLLFNDLNNKQSPDNVEKMIGEWGLEGVKHKKISALSGGQKQAVKMLLIFMAKPKLMIFDEPEIFLDKDNYETFKRKIKKIKNHFILIISHDPDFIEGADTSKIENQTIKKVT